MYVTTNLYGKLDEDIYMEQPEGFCVKGQENKVYQLYHALYGLKQAELMWWHKLVYCAQQQHNHG